MRTVIVLIACLLLCSPALAYYRPEAVDLGGEWEFCPVTPMIDIVPDRYARPDFPQLSPAWDEVIDPQAVPPADAQWMDVTVPLAWESYMGAGYNEAGWYKTTMRIPSAWLGGRSYKKTDAEGLSTNLWVGDKHYWLEFDSVATAAGVWINGEFIGAHVGDYSRWRLEITDAVASELEAAAQRRKSDSGQVSSPSSLEFLVYVDELPGHITQGFLSMIAPHHGGIWQKVRAYATGGVSLSPDGIYISTDWEKQTATFELSFDGDWDSATNFPLVSVIPIGQHTSNFTLYSSLLDTTMQWDFNEQTNQLTMVCNLAGQELVRWSPDVPALYQATISLPGKGTGAGAGDHLLKPFAFRDIRMEDSKVLLNGEQIKIRSVLNWGYYPGVYGSAPSPQTVRNEFAYIKSLGFNAETVCLINMPDYFYTIADQMGLLIWQEYPTWHNDFDAKHIETYRSEFSAYLRRDRNHPSIIMRSLSVEAGVADWDVIDELYALTKEMTDTPVQDNNSWFSHSRPEYTDWYGEDNYFNNAQWERHLRERLPKQLDEYPEKPYIIGESILFNTWPDIDALEGFLCRGGALSPPNPSSASLRACESDLGSREASSRIGKTGEQGSPLPLNEDGLAQGPAPTQSGEGGDSAPPLQGSESQARQPAPPGLENLPAYLGGESDYPWWFPSCYESCKEINAKLRERYNKNLPHGQDIVSDYLLPQSTQYALESRRFQIEMLDSDPRYAGYTVNCVRDMPLIRAGLLDSLEHPRWTPEQWAWHGAPVERASVLADDSGGNEATATESEYLLSKWHQYWNGKLTRYVPVLALREGYIDLQPIIGPWNVRWIDDTELDETRDVPLPTEHSQVVVTSVLTHKLVDYMERGGVVILLTSKLPGGLGSYHHYFWRDAIFVPPVGPWNDGAYDSIVALQPYELNKETAQVIPVDSLGITNMVDPLLRLYDTHDLSSVVTYDQVFAANVGCGMLIASSLDHSTEAGQLVLGKLAMYSNAWCHPSAKYLFGGTPGLVQQTDFPLAQLSVDKLHSLAVSRPNGIMPLDDAWAFSLDEVQVGQSAGWMLPGYDVSAWGTLRAGAGWESQGYSYNGMAWYIREIDVPENWADGKLRLVAEGIDDAYRVWVNGEAVATHGSFTVHEETVWLQQTVTDLTGHLIPGEMNTLALQVVDITGQGGIWKPIYLAVD